MIKKAEKQNFWNGEPAIDFLLVFWKDTLMGSEEAEQLLVIRKQIPAPSEMWHASVLCKEFLFHKDYANVETVGAHFLSEPSEWEEPIW